MNGYDDARYYAMIDENWEEDARQEELNAIELQLEREQKKEKCIVNALNKVSRCYYSTPN